MKTAEFTTKMFYKLFSDHHHLGKQNEQSARLKHQAWEHDQLSKLHLHTGTNTIDTFWAATLGTSKYQQNFDWWFLHSYEGSTIINYYSRVVIL